MPSDRVKRFFRRLKGQDLNKTIHSFPTLRSKPRVEFGWNDFRHHLKSLLKSDLSTSSYSAFLAPLVIVEVEHELFVRWLQASCLLPFFQTASITGHDKDPAVQTVFDLHYRLSAYVASVFALSREYKWPILRSLDRLEPENPKARGIVDTFLLGNALLVAPNVNAGSLQRYVYLPAGKWYSYATSVGYDGHQYVTVDAPLGHLPLFVKAGTALPLKEPDTESSTLVYRIYPGEAESVLYEGDAVKQGYELSDYRWIYITCNWDEGKFVINRRIAGQYTPYYTKIRIEIVDLPSEPTAINIDRRPAPLWYFDEAILEFTTESFQRIELVFESKTT